MLRILFFTLVLMLLVVPMLAQEGDEDSDTFDAYIDEGNLLFDEGNYEEAIELYTGAIEVDPNSPIGHFNRGLAYNRLGEYETAIVNFTNAIEADESYVRAYFERGFAHNELENYVAAVDDFTMTIELDPEYVFAYNNRGFAYNGLEKHQTAIENYTRAIELDPDYVLGYTNRAWTYTRIEEYGLALLDYAAAIELDPNNPDHYLDRANIFEIRGEFDNALAEYDYVIEEIAPNDPDVYLSRGVTYEVMGDTQAATTDFAQYIDLLEVERFTGEITLGETETYEMDEGYVYYLDFDAEAGDEITISAESPDGEVDTLFVLFNSEGEAVASNDDIDADAENFNSLLQAFEIPADDTYTLALTHAGAGSVGEVEVLVEVE